MTGITLLACQEGKTAAKRFTPDGTQDFDAGWLFHHKWFELEGLDQMERMLRKFATHQDKIAIRGRVKEGAPALIRRSKKDATDKYGAEHGPAWVEAVDQQWLMVDLDGVECDDPREVLPDCFHGVKCLVQYSSSHGIKEGFRGHVWFWLDRPALGASVRDWLADTPADNAMFDPVQAHYFANPVFEGVDDPVAQRFEVLDGTPHVELPDCVLDQAAYTKRELERETKRLEAANAATERAAKVRERYEDAGVDTEAAVQDWLERDMDARLAAMAGASEGARHEAIIKTAFYCGAQSQGQGAWQSTGRQMAIDTGSGGAARTWDEHFELGVREGEQFVPTMSIMREPIVIDEALFEWDTPATEQATTIEERIDAEEHCEWVLDPDTLAVLVSIEETDTVRFAIITRKLKGKVNGNLLRSGLATARRDRAKRVMEATTTTDVMFSKGDHAEVAEHLLNAWGTRPVFDLGSLHVFNEDRGTWSDVPVEKVTSSVQDLSLSGAVIDAGEKLKPFMADRSTQKGVAESMFDRVARSGFFEGRRSISFANGTALVDENEQKIILVPHNASLGTRWGFDFELDRDAESPALERFFKSIWADCSDVDERVAFIQEFIGCSIFGLAQREQKALVLLGPAGTGKSTVLNIFRTMLPDDAVTAIPPHHWGDDNKISQLARARANFVYEMPRDYISNVERVKEVIDGAPMTAREAYGRAFTFAPDCVHIFAANRLPEASGAGPDFFDRFMVLDLTRRFRDASEENKDMAAQVSADRAGIVAWCVRGVERYLENGGYSIPPAVTNLKRTWESDIDSVSQWVTEVTDGDVATFEHTLTAYLGVRETYQAYRDWCPLVGRSPVGEKEFVTRLESRGMEARKTAKGKVLPILHTAHDSNVVQF